MTDSLRDAVALGRGKALANRFVLAPLTNCQSHADGTLSDEEFHWLTLRAQGGFALVMTCAAHVQAIGQGFPGQLGFFSDDHLPGLTRLAAEIRRHGSLAWAQLHHAGMRSPAELIESTPVCPSDNAKTGARALSLGEVEQLAEDFIAAAVRAEQAGFDGAELHAAHGYVIAQFLSPEINQRGDRYGGSAENRARLLMDIVEGVRSRCSDDFQLGIRLSPERFGQDPREILRLAECLLVDQRIDLLDMSLWDVFKKAEEPTGSEESLLAQYTQLPRSNTRLTAAGNIRTPQQAEQALAAGLDLVTLGRAAILQYDFPRQYAENPVFAVTEPPVSRDYLQRQGLSEKFIDYMAGWEGFVADSSGTDKP